MKDKVKNKLDLLSMASEYGIIDREDYYQIDVLGADLGADINKKTGMVSYYVTGCYNSGSDDMSINIKELDNLRKFVELLLGDDD